MSWVGLSVQAAMSGGKSITMAQLVGHPKDKEQPIGLNPATNPRMYLIHTPLQRFGRGKFSVTMDQFLEFLQKMAKIYDKTVPLYFFKTFLAIGGCSANE